jgi:hypothetical protein
LWNRKHGAGPVVKGPAKKQKTFKELVQRRNLRRNEWA